MKGKFYGLGVGPGDPELLTLKAHRILREADVICIPKSKKDKDSVALSIINSFISPGAEVMEVVLPMTHDRDELMASWDKAAREVLVHLHAGRDVAFVTIGDAMLYSTYSYLMKRLRSLDPEIEVESVPGITSFSACAARRDLPLAEGEEGLAIVPVLHDVKSLPRILELFPNVVLMKVASQFEEIYQVLEDEGLTGKAVFMSRCTSPGEFFEDNLANLLNSKRDYLSLILVKKGD